VCIRSSLNTNKAPLTYCQLSEVNLSRINFRRKRFRLSGPENPLVSNYLRIDRPAPRRWRDECCLYLYFTASRAHSLSLSRARGRTLSFSLTNRTRTISSSRPLSIPRFSPRPVSPVFRLGYSVSICTHVRAHPLSLASYAVSRRLPHTPVARFGVYIYIHISGA